MARRRRSAHGQVSQKKLRTSVLVACEGKTEREYVNLLKVQRWAGVRFHFSGNIGSNAGTDLGSLIRRIEREEGAYSQRWIMCDGDVNHEYAAQLVQHLHNPGVYAAITYPCFEYWLVLHFGERKGVQTTRDAEKRLQQLVSDYQKGAMPKGVAEGVDCACQRERRNPDHRPPEQYPTRPSSGMLEFVERLDAIAGRGE